MHEENRIERRIIYRDIASVVIVSADGMILMGRKDPAKRGVFPNAWHIPGGGIHPDETPETAAIRETLEETGLDLSGTLLKRLADGSGESDKTLPSGEVVLCKMNFNRFEAIIPTTALETMVSPGDDLVELRWFDAAELREVEQIPGGREFFVRAGYIQD